MRTEVRNLGVSRPGFHPSQNEDESPVLLNCEETPGDARKSLSRSAAAAVYSLSPVRLFATPWTVAPPGSPVHGISQIRILEWVATSFFQRIFPTQGSNPCLLPWQAGCYR